jgi:hypothetical protein
VSEALQNLMMQHGDIRVFLNHYLSRRVSADTQAIVRGLDPQSSIMRSACTMSRWIDPDRPWGLTSEQASSVNNDPLIRALVEKRKRLNQLLKRKTAGHQEYQELNKGITNERQRLRAALLKEIQEKYEREEPVRVIEEQLSGLKISKKPKVFSYFTEDTLPEQRRLIETIILAPPGETLEMEIARRNNGINAVCAYCKIEEGQTRRGRKPASTQAIPVIKQEEDAQSSEHKALETAMLSVFIGNDLNKRTKVCAWCVGNTALPLKDRIYEFSTPGDLSKHFRRKHLKYLEEGERLGCKICKLQLKHKTHL